MAKVADTMEDEATATTRPLVILNSLEAMVTDADVACNGTCDENVADTEDELLTKEAKLYAAERVAITVDALVLSPIRGICPLSVTTAVTALVDVTTDASALATLGVANAAEEAVTVTSKGTCPDRVPITVDPLLTVLDSPFTVRTATVTAVVLLLTAANGTVALRETVTAVVEVTDAITDTEALSRPATVDTEFVVTDTGTVPLRKAVTVDVPATDTAPSGTVERSPAETDDKPETITEPRGTDALSDAVTVDDDITVEAKFSCCPLTVNDPTIADSDKAVLCRAPAPSDQASWLIKVEVVDPVLSSAIPAVSVAVARIVCLSATRVKNVVNELPLGRASTVFIVADDNA